MAKQEFWLNNYVGGSMKILLMFVLIYALKAEAAIVLSPEDASVGPNSIQLNNNKPIFILGITNQNSKLLEQHYYEVSYMRRSRNYVNLIFKHIHSVSSSYHGPLTSSLKDSICFRTESWKPGFEQMNVFSVDHRDSNRSFVQELSLIFKRTTHLQSVSKPYPIPIPLPFQVLPNTRRYNMINTEKDSNGKVLSEEIITVSFNEGTEEVNAMDLYKEGFTDITACSSL